MTRLYKVFCCLCHRCIRLECDDVKQYAVCNTCINKLHERAIKSLSVEIQAEYQCH